MKAYKYGIELETVVDYDKKTELFDAIQKAKLPYDWKRDGSIQEGSNQYGVEFVCQGKGLGYTRLERSVKALSKILNEYDVQVNSTTGFHVHMSNKRFFNPKTLKRIIHVWTSIEDVLMSTQPRSRFNNRYCQRLLRQYIENSNEKLPKTKDQLVGYLGSKDRYYALNLASLQAHGTLEVRLHSGTIDSKKIIAWVQLIQSIFDYAIERYNYNEVTARFGESISDQKIDSVFKMLGLSKSLTQHFKKRINKFGFSLLARQQSDAVKALAIKPRLDKTKKAYQKLQDRMDGEQTQFNSYLRSFSSSL